MKFPFVSRKKHDSLKHERDYFGAVVAERSQEVTRQGARIKELESELSELNAPGEDTRRQIAEVEGQIQVEELRAKLRKLKEPEDDDQPHPRPTVDKVLRVAAKVREQRKVSEKKP